MDKIDSFEVVANHNHRDENRQTKTARNIDFKRFLIISRQKDLNPQPSDYDSDALPIELCRHALPEYNNKGFKRIQDMTIKNPVFSRSLFDGNSKRRMESELISGFATRHRKV